MPVYIITDKGKSTTYYSTKDLYAAINFEVDLSITLDNMHRCFDIVMRRESVKHGHGRVHDKVHNDRVQFCFATDALKKALALKYEWVESYDQVVRLWKSFAEEYADDNIISDRGVDYMCDEMLQSMFGGLKITHSCEYEREWGDLLLKGHNTRNQDKMRAMLDKAFPNKCLVEKKTWTKMSVGEPVSLCTAIANDYGLDPCDVYGVLRLGFVWGKDDDVVDEPPVKKTVKEDYSDSDEESVIEEDSEGDDGHVVETDSEDDKPIKKKKEKDYSDDEKGIVVDDDSDDEEPKSTCSKCKGNVFKRVYGSWVCVTCSEGRMKPVYLCEDCGCPLKLVKGTHNSWVCEECPPEECPSEDEESPECPRCYEIMYPGTGSNAGLWYCHDCDNY